MTINAPIRMAGLLAIVVSIGACNHPTADVPVPALVVSAVNDATLTPTVVPLIYTPAPVPTTPPEFIFDWENAQYVPNPLAEKPVPVPWSDQAKRAFSDDIRYDYRKADGWELVHSTFSSQSLDAYQFITLYNRYRGLLRIYFYERGNVESLQNNAIAIQHVKTVSPSPLLNFAEQTVVDVSQSSTSYVTLEPQATSTGAWYAFQYEVAFDAKQASQQVYHPLLDFEVVSDQVSSVSLNGGKAMTTLPIGLHIVGLSKGAGLPSYDGAAQLLITGPGTVAALQNAGQDVQAINNSLTGITGNVLSGVITAQSTTTSSFLPYAATVHLTKPTDRYANLLGVEFVLPTGGVINSKPPYTPQFNEPIGVFYVDSKPVITTQTSTTGSGSYVYSLDVSSVRYLFNPVVTNGADIKNIKQEIVATAVAAPEASPLVNPTLYAGTTLTANQALNVIGVRVSFDVVPKSGSAPVHIIKTFKADLKAQ